MSNVQSAQPQSQAQMAPMQQEQTGDMQIDIERRKEPTLNLRGGGIILDLCACFICCEACKGCCEMIDDCCCC